MRTLPSAPDTLVGDGGEPNLGVFAGRMRDTSFDRLEVPFRRAGLARRALEKRWHYACVVSPGLVVGGAVVRLGHFATAFAYVFDRRARKLLADKSLVAPLRFADLDDFAGEARGSVRGLRARVLIEASRLGGRFAAWFPGELSVEIRLRPETAPEALTAACPLPGAQICVTQKTCCVKADGEVRLGGNARPIEGLANLDYSHGLLGPVTRWRWASAAGVLPDGRDVAINLVEGHNDGEVTENAIWVGQVPIPVERARIERDSARGPWRVATRDRRVELAFHPEGVRSQRLELGIIGSSYVQPIGAYRGILRPPGEAEIAVENLAGVAEDHRARW